MSKDWYIWLDGIKVSVTEEVYRTYDCRVYGW